MIKEYVIKSKKKRVDTQAKLEMIEGYKEMSRINSMLAESAVQSDNEALMLGEQKLAECE